MPDLRKFLKRKYLVGAALAATVVAGVALALPDASAASTFSTVQPGTFTGQAFDACTAPSQASMTAWRSKSPYRAIGIYIGGSNRGCAQPNLTADWVRAQVNAGWHLIPLYVGPQATCNTVGKHNLINNGQAGTQGAAAAVDAVAQARKLGLAPSSVLIYDMESYRTTDSACRAGVLTFMNSWTWRLHDLGYLSGFYSSIGSGGADQVARYSVEGYVRPDYLDFARWDKVATTTDAAIPSSAWPGHRRMKQYQGGHQETYGGVTINIDSDYVDFALPPSARMADWNRNGWSDVLARSSNGVVSYYSGNGTVVGGARTVASGFAGMNAIARIGDLTKDGYDDLVARAADGSLYLYPGTSGGTLSARKLLSRDFKRMREITAVGDLNKDGYPDLVAVQISDGGLYFYPGVKGGKLGTRYRIAAAGWNTMSELTGIGDFTGDGYPDLVTRRTATGELFLYQGKKGGIGAATRIATGFGQVRDLVGVGDFDRDGRLDLAGVRQTDGALMLYRGTATGLQAGVRLSAGWGARGLLS